MTQLHALPGGAWGGVGKGSRGMLCNYQEGRKCARREGRHREKAAGNQGRLPGRRNIREKSRNLVVPLLSGKALQKSL